jgi:hypothetical protein
MTLRYIGASFIRLTTVLCFAAVMSDCAEDLYSPYAAPGKFDFLDCPSIADRITKASDKERELAELMARASQGAGGALVNAIATRTNTTQSALNCARCASPPT